VRFTAMTEPEQKWTFLSSDDIFLVKILILVILPKRIICDSEWQSLHRHSDWQPHTFLKHCVSTHLRKVANSTNDCNCRFRTEMATKRKNSFSPTAALI